MAKGLAVFKHVALYLCMALFVVSMSATQLCAQAQTATISGTATDTSGAAMVGAKIQATNTDTNVSQSTVSDSQGRYTLADLPVGTYSVQASQSGFRTVVHPRVTLSVGGTIVVDFSMPVGEVSQTVSVESQVSRVETTSSEVSTLVSPTQMRELPLNGRNFEQLLALAPGVSTIAPAFNAVTGRLYGMMNNYSIAGSRPTGQMFLLDGTDIRDFWEHATGSGYAGTSLGVEAIGQFQVLTSDYTAQYGGNGAVMNAVSRSGTNDLHGGVYEFIRNSALDDRDAPDILAGLSGPPPFKRNQFGVALGGPIKKDKLFFFGNYEGLREGLESTTPQSVPEPYVAAGMLPCYSPLLTTTTAGTTTAAQLNTSASCPVAPPPFTAVGTSANPVEPVSFANAQSENIAALYSLCRGCTKIRSTQVLNGTPVTFAPGTDLGGYLAVKTEPDLITNEDYTLDRVDYTISSTDNVFVRYVFDDARVADNPRDPLGITPEQDFTRNQFLTISENHVFSPTKINSIRFGYVRNNENSRVQEALTSAQISSASAFSTSVGGPAFTTDPLKFVSGSDPQPREDGQDVLFSGITVIGPDQNRPDALIQSKFSGGDDLVWTHGGHSLKIGAVITRVDTNNIQAAYANGTYYLSYATVPDLAGQFFLQGLPEVAFAVPAGENDSTRYFREIYVAPYIQDDWKVTSHLTLNLGFRWDYDTNPVGWSYGNLPLGTLVGSFLPPVGPVIMPPGPLASYAPYTAVHHVLATNPNAKNFEPRFGFAYSPFPDNKTAFRGGAGVFYDPTAARLWESGFIATPPAGFSLIIFPGFPNAYTGGLLGTPINTGPSEFAGVTYQLSGRSAITSGSPYQIQYNFDIQRQLTPATILTIGYVGSVSRHLWTQGDINPPECLTFPSCTALPQVPTSLPTASNATYTVTTTCLDPTETSCYGSGVQFPCPSGCTTQGPRINPTFGEMIQAYNNGASSYNSLQVSLNHQFASNFTGQFNYTYSHCIDDGSFASSLEEWGQLQTDRYNPSYDYENCNFDLRNNVSANALYTLPFKGNRLVEGWRFSTIVGIHSGLPLNIYNSGIDFADPADLGTEWNSRANYSFAAGCHPNHILDKVVGTATIEWFDPSCYEAQAPGFLGNISRNSVPGPGTVGVDLSITKETKLTERLNMEFRAEAFNFINHFNPGAQSPTSGAILGAIEEPGAGETSFSQSPTVTPRQLQFALKFDF
jgi:Carboxypeptidase regulatory-like domain/TonB-dependent Receptor Plug Domain